MAGNRKTKTGLLLVCCVLIVGTFYLVSRRGNKANIRDKVWYTYCYFQKKAAREARGSRDTDIAFNQLWERYDDSVINKCHISSGELDRLLQEKIDEMANTKDWSDNRLTEDEYRTLINK